VGAPLPPAVEGPSLLELCRALAYRMLAQCNFCPWNCRVDRVTRAPRRTDTFRWRLAIGAVLIAGGYGAWLTIPLVVASDLSPSIKTALTAVLGATPLLTKLLAIALLGRPNDRVPEETFFKTASGKIQAPLISWLTSALGRCCRKTFFEERLSNIDSR